MRGFSLKNKKNFVIMMTIVAPNSKSKFDFCSNLGECSTRKALSRKSFPVRRIGEENANKEDDDDDPRTTEMNDSYAIFRDINCNQWIITLINNSLIFPRVQLPSNKHFHFSSVHDITKVKHLNRNGQNCSKNILKICCCCCCGCCCWICCAKKDKITNHKKDGQNSSTTTTTSPTKFHSKQTDPLSSVSVICAKNPQQQQQQQQPVMLITGLTDTGYGGQDGDYNYDEDETAFDQYGDDYGDYATPDLSVSITEQHPPLPPLQQSSLNHQQNNDQQLQRIKAVQGDDNRKDPDQEPESIGSKSSTSATLAKRSSFWCFQSWKCYLIILFFVIITVRYITHLVLIMWYRHPNRSLTYNHCPLIVALFETLSSLLTMLIIYCRRSPLEELIITIASFFRPLTSWQRLLFIQTIAIIYLLINLTFVLINCCAWFPNMTNIDSTWHRYRRSESDFGSLNMIVWPNQTSPVPAATATNTVPSTTTITPRPRKSTTIKINSTMAISNNRTLKKERSVIDDFDLEPESNWNSTGSPWDDYYFPLNIGDNQTESDNDTMMMTMVNFQPNETDITNADNVSEHQTWRVPRYSPTTPGLPNRQSTSSNAKFDNNDLTRPTTTATTNFADLLSKANWRCLLFYLDFLAHFISTYSVLLMKTFFVNISLLLMLKCRQLLLEIRGRKQRLLKVAPMIRDGAIRDKNIANSNHDLAFGGNQNIIVHQNRRKAVRPNAQHQERWRRRRRQQSEMERLTILTKVLANNIGYYENMFGNLLIIWLFCCLANALIIWQFYACVQQQQQQQRQPNWNRFEPFFCWGSIIIHGLDFFILFGFYFIIRFLRCQCIMLIYGDRL